MIVLLRINYIFLVPTRARPPARLPYIPYQVVNAQQQGLYASRCVGVSGCADGQEAPQELGQELQREALQQGLAAPVKLKQLMTDRFEQLRKTTSTKEREKKKEKENRSTLPSHGNILVDKKVEDNQGSLNICLEPIRHRVVRYSITDNTRHS